MIGALQQEYKDLYASEIQRRDVLSQAVDRPIAIITAFVGVVYFTISDLRWPLGYYGAIQLLLAVAAVLAILVAVYLIVRAYWNYAYCYVPTPQQLEDYRASLGAYYREHFSNDQPDLDAKVLAYIYDAYIKGAHANALNNRQRSDYLHRAKTVLIVALLIVVTMGMLKAVAPLLIGDPTRETKHPVPHPHLHSLPPPHQTHPNSR